MELGLHTGVRDKDAFNLPGVGPVHANFKSLISERRNKRKQKAESKRLEKRQNLLEQEKKLLEQKAAL